MPIEGPLREFGIHDVFQLLDLSRKTGMLRVTSELRDDEGRVYFEAGKVVHANLRSLPNTIEETLVDAGKITDAELQHARKMVADHGSGVNLSQIFVQAGVVSDRDLERLVKTRLETIVFELMSWREGFFSFEEGQLDEVPAGSRMLIATESLLMEGARRIDEWSRIADKVPNLTVIPALAPVPDDHESQLDLLPNEWEVLTMIDGERDLRGIADALGRNEFEIAKVAYGLATTGVVEIRQPRRLSATIVPAEVVVHPALGMARSLAKAGRPTDAMAELEKAVDLEPMNAELWMELGYLALKNADFEMARNALGRFLKLAPSHPDASQARSSLDAVTKLLGTLTARDHG
jgi:hypothetical protein